MPYDNQPAYDRLVFELSSPGRMAFSLPESDVPVEPALAAIPERFRRATPAALPEVSELDVVRHYSRLSQMNYGVDTHFYPLGSCTMKYNPKINEDAARIPGFARLHPLAPAPWRRARCSSCTTSDACWPRWPAWTRCRYSRRPAPRASWPAC
jgi:glycine cleavage system protein P-like pyridoxal-binding family